MIHNVIVVNGIEYKAAKNSSCAGCAFDDLNTGLCKQPHTLCCASEREDDTGVVYKRHYKLKHNG